MLNVTTCADANPAAIELAAAIIKRLGQNANAEVFVANNQVSIDVFSKRNYHKAVSGFYALMGEFEDAWYDDEDLEYRFIATNGMYASVMKLDW